MASSASRPVYKDIERYITKEGLTRVYNEVIALHDKLYNDATIPVPSTALLAMMHISLNAMRSCEVLNDDLRQCAERFFAEQRAIAAAFDAQEEAELRRARDAERKRADRAEKRRKRALEQLGVSDPDAPVDEQSASEASDQPPRKRRSRPTVRLNKDGTLTEKVHGVFPEYPSPDVLLSPPCSDATQVD